ncbi:MAG: DUF790 family protein [Planctomycetota bacterium]|nr:MAG: DUF790 family protein [Planctomycetota bacterium]
MLSRDLLRARRSGDGLQALWLTASPSLRELCDALLHLWRSCLGATRAEVEEQLPPIIHRSRSQVVARGLNKIISDAATFSDATDLRALRSAALTASAQALHEQPAQSAEAHRQSVAAALPSGTLPSLAEDPGSLYGDLPQHARLETAPEWSSEGLIDRYNMALAQGLLMGAQSLQVHIGSATVDQQRRVVKALRLHRLLVALSHDDQGCLQLEISGPGAVLDQQSRYGLQLACFLPHLCTLPQWRAQAFTRIPRERDSMAWLRLDNTCPLRGHSHFLGHTPPELQRLHSVLAEKLPQWHCDDSGEILPMANGSLIIPDLVLSHPTAGRWYLECFHRWHAHALDQRLQHIRQGLAPRLLLAVDRHLARKQDHAAALDDPELQHRVCLFRDYPTPTALGKILKHLALPPS